MRQFKLITFDVNGTLLKTRHSVGQIYSQTAERVIGVQVSPETLNTHFRPVWRELNAQYPNFGLHSDLGWENWWKRFVQVTFVRSGAKIERDQLNKLSDELLSLFSTKNGWSCKDEAEVTLRTLKSSASLGVISNFDPRLHQILRELDLDRYFSFVITSYEAGFSKPDSRIFEKAAQTYLEQTGSLLSREEILHVGDDLENDYSGAKNVGWHAILISKIQKEEDKICVIPSLSHLLKFLSVK